MNKYMEIAYKEALKAYKKKEVPVGAVIVYNDIIIAKGYNKREKTNKISDHAEIIALNKAGKKLKTWKLKECDIYITLEPCEMCYDAIVQARIKNIYCAAHRNNNKLYKKISFIENNEKYEKLIKNFFIKLRK